MIWFWISDTDQYGNPLDFLSGQQVRLTDAWRYAMIEGLEEWLKTQSACNGTAE